MLDRVRNGQKLLDLGCAFGQELRQLVCLPFPIIYRGSFMTYLFLLTKVFNGAPSENLYGSDLHYDFMTLGYDLFRDRDTLKSTFIEADILEENSMLLTQLTGQLNIIYNSLFFHLFNWDQQLRAINHMLRLLAPNPGSLITGRFVAFTDTDKAKSIIGTVLPFYHSLESWKELWEVVRQSTGTTLRLETWQEEDLFLTDEETTSFMLCFAVYRE